MREKIEERKRQRMQPTVVGSKTKHSTAAQGTRSDPVVLRSVGEFERFMKQRQAHIVCDRFSQSTWTLQPNTISAPIDVLFVPHLNDRGQLCSHVTANRSEATRCRLCLVRIWSYLKPPGPGQVDLQPAQVHFKTEWNASVGIPSRL